MLHRTPIACLCLAVLLGGCQEANRPKKEAWQKREQVYTDKTPREWLELIQHREFRVREKAIDALIQYRKDGEDTVAELIEILETHGSSQVRLSVARALGGMRSDAKPAVPALCKALKDSNWNGRDAAAEALGTIRGDLGRTIPALVGALNGDQDERVRGKAAEALGRLRSGEAKAVAALAAALQDADANVQAYAAEALGQIGQKAKAAVPALEKAAQLESFIVSDAARRALGKVQGR